MIKFKIWQFILLIGVVVGTDGHFTDDYTVEQITNIMNEIITPWKTLSDVAIRYFIKFANVEMSKMGKNFKLLEVTITKVPEACEHHAKYREDDVQIMYGGSGGDVGGEKVIGHYICIHYLHQLRKVRVYDSLRSKLYPDQIDVLKKLYPWVDFKKSSSIQYMKPKTRQNDSTSCGLFSIAYATTIIFGRDPETYELYLSKERGVDQSLPLRNHLLEMLSTETFSVFPTYEDTIASIPSSENQKPNKKNERTTSRPSSSKTPVKRSDTASSSSRAPSRSTSSSSSELDSISQSFKYMSILTYKHNDRTTYMVSGTVISNTKIVTTAQNVANRKSVQLLLNTLHVSKSNNKIDVATSEILIHPGYNADSCHANDLAVISLKNPLRNAVTIPLVASNYLWKTDERVTMIGYTANGMHSIDTKVTDFVACRYSYWERNKYRVLEEGKQFCVSTKDNDISMGWTGGAVVTRDGSLLGVISYNYDGLPEVCTLTTGSNNEFISNPRGFIREYTE